MSVAPWVRQAVYCGLLDGAASDVVPMAKTSSVVRMAADRRVVRVAVVYMWLLLVSILIALPNMCLPLW